MKVYVLETVDAKDMSELEAVCTTKELARAIKADLLASEPKLYEGAYWQLWEMDLVTNAEQGWMMGLVLSNHPRAIRVRDCTGKGVEGW